MLNIHSCYLRIIIGTTFSDVLTERCYITSHTEDSLQGLLNSFRLGCFENKVGISVKETNVYAGRHSKVTMILRNGDKNNPLALLFTEGRASLPLARRQK